MNTTISPVEIIDGQLSDIAIGTDAVLELQFQEEDDDGVLQDIVFSSEEDSVKLYCVRNLEDSSNLNENKLWDIDGVFSWADKPVDEEGWVRFVIPKAKTSIAEGGLNVKGKHFFVIRWTDVDEKVWSLSPPDFGVEFYYG